MVPGGLLVMSYTTLLMPRIEDLSQPPIEQIFSDQFDSGIIQAVREMGQPVEEIELSFENYALNRGVLAAITIDPQTGRKSGAVPAALGGYADGY